MTDAIKAVSVFDQLCDAHARQHDAEQDSERLQKLYALITLCELLNQRGERLGPVEYNGLLRMALCLKVEIDLFHNLHNQTPADDGCDWRGWVDEVLDQTFVKPPLAYAQKLAMLEG